MHRLYDQNTLAERLRLAGLRKRQAWALETKASTFECTDCHMQISVTAGTIIHGSKPIFMVWFWVAYLMASHANGISALELQKQLGLGSYKSDKFLSTKQPRPAGG